VALVAGLCVRLVSARATLHARARTKMAREARAGRRLVGQLRELETQAAVGGVRSTIYLLDDRIIWGRVGSKHLLTASLPRFGIFLGSRLALVLQLGKDRT